MPLPKEYYDILKTGDKPLTSPVGTSGLYPDLTPDMPEDQGSAWDSVGDFVWQFGAGGVSGLTWGASELAAPSKPWEEMSTAERSGWILGEGASLFAPWGPFGLLGKASRLTAKGANKFVGKAAQEAAETGIANLTGKQAAAVAKATEKGVNFSDDIVQGLNKVAKDDLGVKWIKDLGATGTAALNASDNLTASGTRAVMKSFKDAGMDIAERDATRIAGEFVESVKGGTYVNDIAEWVTRGLAGRIPDTAKGFMSKYLGMAAQDLMMIGTHSLISGKLKALANGEDFDATDALSHAGIMSLGFPLIRKIPGGGVANISTGVKAYMGRFKNTNYKAIEEAHGSDVVKNMLRLMVRGEKKDLWSRSKLGDAHWKAGGKVYKSAEEIERALPKMKMPDVHTLLNKMNKTVNQELLKKWGPGFLEDLGKSTLRMGVGVLAMNPWVLDKDAWGSMEGPELASHMFMSAIMTKGRGAWGHKEQRAYFADFTPYHEALHLLGVDTKNVQDVLRFHDGKAVYEGMGLALGTHEVGQELVNIFDGELKTAESRPSGRDFSNPDHGLVMDLGNLYNVIKNQADPNFKGIKMQNLDSKTLNNLAHKLKGIKFSDGTTVDEIGYEGALVKLTLEPAKRGLEIYKQMLSSLGSELGYDISVTADGRVTGSHIMSNKEGKTIDDANTYNRVLDALAGINEASVKTGIDGQSDRVNYEKIVKKSGLTEQEFNIRTREIIDEHMDVLGREYGDKNIYRDPVNDNPMFDFFKQAKGIEAAERVYSIATGKFPTGDPASDGILTENLDTLFKLGDGKYANSIDSYKTLVKELIKDPQTDKDKVANEKIVENIEDLRQLFDLRKTALGGTSTKDAGEKGKIDAEGLSIVQKKWQDIYKSLPIEWKENWASHTKKLYIERMYKGRGFDRRAINLLSFMSDNGLVLPGTDGSINMPSKEAVLQELKGKVSKKELAEYERALSTIRQVLGDDVVKEIDWAFTESGRRQLEEVDMSNYLKASKLLGNEMYSDMLVNTQAVLQEISSKSRGMRQRIHELHDEITTLLDTLDPASNKVPVKDPIGEINALKDKLMSLEEVARTKESKDDLGQAIIQLHILKDEIDPSTRKFNISPKRLEDLTQNEQLSGDSFGVHDALTRPLQTTLSKLFAREHESVDKLRDLVVKLENLSSVGKAGLGLDKSDTMRIIEDMSREWYEVYKGEKGKGVKVLSELITEINQKGFFGDAIKLLEGINERVNREVILNNEHHWLNEDGVRMSESLENGYKTHEHHRTAIEIAKDYGLVDKNGKIDESFKIAVSQNPFRALSENVRKKIFDQDPAKKTLAQKQSEWRKFREKDAVELLTNILNSKPINRIKILGITEAGEKRGIIEFNNNAPHIQHPNTQYFNDKGYKVHWIDDTMSIDIGDGKLRNASISRFESPDKIQKFLNEALHTDKVTQDILDGFKSIDTGLSERDIRKILENPTDYVFYLRLSPMDKMMFIGTEKNLKLMDTEFETWYDNALNRYSGRERDIFKQMFEHLKTASNSSRHMVELKMLLPYIEHAGKRSALDQMIAEYAGDARPQTLAKIQANMYKRGFLSDGGTTQPMRPEVLNWMKSHHPNTEVREIADNALQNGGFVAGVLGDNAAEGNKSHPLNIENIEMGQLQVIGNQASGLVKEIALAQQRSLDNMPSLMASLLDGGKFASEKVMKLVMAQKGMLDTDFTNSPNGAKTIIFAVGGNQMLGKGYMIYHPEIAAHMPAGVDILLGETSAKTYDGTAMNGSKLSAYDMSGAGTAWQSSIRKMGNGNKMLIPIESLGVSFTSKKESGVTISPSIFDFQSPVAIDKAIAWMGFEAKLKQIGMQWNSVHRDGAKLAEWLYEIGASEGNPLDKGDTGLSKLLFEYGAMPNNPLVQKALRRLLRSSNYKHLGKIPNQQGGEDNFIVPNIDGKLSVPLYAELHDSGTGVKIDRATVTYGGIGLNKNTAGRQLGNGIGSNLEGERFIFRDGNGVDVVIGIENGKFKFYSTFYDKAGKDIQYKGTDAGGVDALRDANISMESNSRVRAEAQLKDLMDKVKQNDLNYFDVFRLLNGQTITKEKNGITSTFDMPVDVSLKMQFGLMSHAVPVVGHDKVIFRVEKVLNNMEGLTEVNVHDLRTVMQRDNDGDHLYQHTKLPWEVFEAFARENGRKDDFRMFDRGEVLNSDYINIFGIGNNGRAGEKGEQVGFHNYAAKLHKAQMMVGEVIGVRNAVSWLNRVGFNMDGKPLLKDMISRNEMSSDTWKTMDKFYDTIQNALDIHGGIHEAIQNKQKLKDFLYFGHSEKYTKDTGDPVFDKHNQPGLGFFNDGSFGKTRIQKEMFYEILRTLKKANMIQNDTWDEKGSRSPEPFEIKNAYYDMRAFFTNPNAYLAKKLARKIGRMSDADGARSKLMAEYAEMFYGDVHDMKRREGRTKLYFDILEGKHDSIMKQKFSFDNIPADNPLAAFDKSIGGHLMKGLLGTNGFWDANYGGLENGNMDMYNKAGFFVKSIESFVETARMFGDDPIIAAHSFGEKAKGAISITSFSSEIVSPEIRSALNNGILRELIQRQHRNIVGTLEYFRAERFTNPDKVEKLQRRLGNLQAAVDIMDNQIARNMVIERPDARIVSPKKRGKMPFSYLQKGREVDVYRVRGDVKVINKDEKPTLYNHRVDGEKRLDYGQLEFVGKFDRNSKPLLTQVGYSYIIDPKPKKRISQSSNEARYSQALFKATYGNDTNPDRFIKSENVSDFRDDVRRLRASISMDYIKTVQDAMSNRVLSEGLYALEQAKEGRAIAEFVERWKGSVIESQDPMNMLLRYLLQPQVTPSSYYKDAQGHEMPAYKTNEHLYKTLLQWAENNGHHNFVRELVKDVEHYAAGKDTEVDISSYGRSTRDRFDYSQLPKGMINPIRSLVKHMDMFFASPTLTNKLDGIIPKTRGEVKTVIDRDGNKVPIRRQPKTGEFWKIQTDQTGEGC